MELDTLHNVYLVGIGGIGMSALARYFHSMGKKVAGYDRTETPLTRALVLEGMHVHYTDDPRQIPLSMTGNPADTLVILTPAIPATHKELNYFLKAGYAVMKRSRVLGMLSGDYTTYAIAGTHGKTTISTMVASILGRTPAGCIAFLGGISKNFGSNLLVTPKATTLVAEADEYDRSFLQLRPTMAVVTAIDDDHLDIYGDREHLIQSFRDFINQIKPGGILLLKKGLDIAGGHAPGIRVFSYHLDSKADFYATNLSVKNGMYHFDLVTPTGLILDLVLGLPGRVNVENAIAAAGITLLAGWGEEVIRQALADFQGVVRRFDIRFLTSAQVYMDDYAHHPEELKACITSVREMFPGRHITGIFQPHLYSRTRDLASDFARSLDMLDRLILLDIYPAREEPIPGVSTALIFDKVKLKDKQMCRKEEVIKLLKKQKTEILLSLGAGDIDTLAEPLVQWLTKKQTKE
jgi:UDP-N-acetylmuramate--alanine ligase